MTLSGWSLPMEPTPSVLNPQPDFRTAAMAVKASRKPGKWLIAFSLLGLAILGGVGVYVYAMDPWHWRGLDRETSAATHWEEARNAMEDREFGLAREHLGKYLKVLPFNAEAHFLL